MEIEVKKTKRMQAAVFSHVRPYSEASKLHGEIVKWLRQKQLRIAGPLLGWFYDNPEKVPPQELRSEVSFRFKGEPKSEGNINIKKIPAREVISTAHKGPYGEVGLSYNALFEHPKEKGYTPLECPIEIYLNDPTKVSESELQRNTIIRKARTFHQSSPILQKTGEVT
jgi:AraC family transcriptional regulator